MAFPSATNSLNSLGIYEQRFLYNKEYPSDVPLPVDLWYEKHFYGRSNLKNESIFLSEAVLKQLKTSNKNILMATNFVVDAFEDFRIFIERSKKQAKIDINDSFLKDIEPRTAWVGVNALYQQHVAVLYDAFRDSFVKDFERNLRIKDFTSFMKVFLEYIDMISASFPFTRTAFIMTRFCPIEISGLSIQISKENHAQDSNKYEKFILDKNFSFYAKAASRFGFLVDKNAPWRLVADLESPIMKKYMNIYNVDIKNIFDVYYYKSFNTELDLIRIYITQIYNSYVFSEPYNKSVKINKTSCSNKIIVEKTQRKTTSHLNYNDFFWLKIFAYIRARETNTKFSQQAFDALVQQSYELFKMVNKNKAIEYIENHLTPVNVNLLASDISVDKISEITLGLDSKRIDFSC